MGEEKLQRPLNKAIQRLRPKTQITNPKMFAKMHKLQILNF